MNQVTSFCRVVAAGSNVNQTSHRIHLEDRYCWSDVGSRVSSSSASLLRQIILVTYCVKLRWFYLLLPTTTTHHSIDGDM